MKSIKFTDRVTGQSVTLSETPTISTNGDVRLPKLMIVSNGLTPNASTNTIDGLTTSKNEVACTIRLIGKDISFEDTGVIAYQGATSLAAPKKGFTIDTDNKHRFGNWVEMDSFHVKGYFTDWMHVRDLCANRLLEQMMMSLDALHRRPYMPFNNFDADDPKNLTDVGAKCHIDGFPVELYINDVYWGLYSINIKKNRDNYLQKKKDVQHIQLEMANWCNLGTTDWTKIEIRNPKGDSGNNSFEEGVEPADGEVKTAWTTFITFMNSITSSTAKADIEEHVNISTFIDSILFLQMINSWDCITHNNLFTTWDGVHWSLLNYDFDNSFGIENDFEVAYPQGKRVVASNYITFARSTDGTIRQGGSAYGLCPWLSTLETIYADDIETRYADLRNRGIFSVENIIGLVEDFTRQVGLDVYKDDTARWSYPNLLELKDGIARYYTWLTGRLVYLDNKYNYTA